MSDFADFVKSLKCSYHRHTTLDLRTQIQTTGEKSPKSQSLNMRSQGRNGIQTWAQLQKTGSTKPEQKSWKNEAIITGFLIAFTMTMSK